MQIPKYIEIKNANGQRVAFLSPKSDGLKECWTDARLNGESTLEFMLPANSEKIEELTPECQIWAGGRVYTLLQDEASDTIMEENGSLWTKFMAVERWAELDSQYIEPYLSNDPTIPVPADLAVIIVGGGTNLSGGIYPTGSAVHAMYAVLQGSGWSLGTVDVLGIHDLEMEKVSRLQLIKEIQKIWGGYLVWDSVNKIVHLRSGDFWQNYTGFQIRYAKNLKHITRTQSNRLVTKLYCFGYENLDIASVNNGNKFIVNTSYTTREYVGIYSNPDIKDAEELKEKGEAELDLMCRPRYNYQIKVVDLRTLPEYNHEDFSLGDMTDVINPRLKINENVRIIRHKYNLFQPWKSEMELGDPLERLVEQLKTSFNTAGFINNTFNSSGYMSGGKLVDLSITYKQLGMASVTTQAIAPLAVNTEKLANLAVEAAKLADSAVTTTKIANAAVGSAAIAQAAIGTVHIGTGVIVTAHIGDLQVVRAKIGDAAINDAKIDNLAVTSAKIRDLAVTTIKIGDLVITEEKIASLAVSTSKLQNLAVTNAKIDNLAVDTAKIANLAVTNAKINDLAANKITAGTITATVSLTAATITSLSEINVTTNARVGESLIFQGSGPKSIYLSGTASISFNPSTNSMWLSALNNIQVHSWYFYNNSVEAFSTLNMNGYNINSPGNIYTQSQSDNRYCQNASSQRMSFQVWSGGLQVFVNGSLQGSISFDD